MYRVLIRKQEGKRPHGSYEEGWGFSIKVDVYWMMVCGLDLFVINS